MSHNQEHVIAFGEYNISAEEIEKFVCEELYKEDKVGLSPWNIGTGDRNNTKFNLKTLGSTQAGFVILAGGFNYWDWESARRFSLHVSKTLKIPVIHSHWDTDGDGTCHFMIAKDGVTLTETERLAPVPGELI